MKNKNITKLVVTLTLMAVCGLSTGCGASDMQDVLGQMAQQEESEERKTEEESKEEVSEESEEESKEEDKEESKEEPKEESDAPAVALDGEWTDMKFVLDGKTYQLPFAYEELEAEGWTFDLADYGYQDGYKMEPGDKVYATIDLKNPAYGDKLDIRVGFKNYSDETLDIKECDVWSLEFDTYYAGKQLESYPDMSIGNGLAIGSSKSDVEEACGACDEIYSSDLGYDKYSYVADDCNLDITIYEDMGVTAFKLSTYE